MRSTSDMIAIEKYGKKLKKLKRSIKTKDQAVDFLKKIGCWEDTGNLTRDYKEKDNNAC